MVLVEPVAELEVVVREEPITPVIPLALLEEERGVIVISSDEEDEGLGSWLERNFAHWVADGNPPDGWSSSLEAGPSQVTERSRPPSYHSLSPHPPAY